MKCDNVKEAMLPRLLSFALLASLYLSAQIGGPYPGGGYPPGTYPPGTYPPGYPGGGVGFPMPGRGGKSRTEQSKRPAVSLSGKINHLDSAKSKLTLAADDGRNIELTVSKDTKISAESGDLKFADLHVNDELSIQAHTDDRGFFYADEIRVDKVYELPKTSTGNTDSTGSGGARSASDDPDRPVLRRAPSTDQKAGDDKVSDAKSSAKTDKPAANTSGKTPGKADDEYENGEEHPILPAGGVSSAKSDDPDRPILRRGTPPRRAASDQTRDDSDSGKPASARSPEDKPVQIASARTDSPAIHDAEPEIHIDRNAVNPGDEFIQKAREAAFEFDEKLPNFVCQQLVARYQSETRKPDWHAIDTVSYDLVYEDGKEQYKNPKINGKPVKAGADKDSGAWSSGEFGTLLKDVFHPSTNANFRPKGQETISHRTAKVYSFTVDKDHSHWHVQGGSQWILPPYKGTIWLDKETYRALRIEMEATNIPAGFIMDHVETAADYDFVMIKTQKYLLPTHAETLTCERGTFNCARNAIDFRNYRAYMGESSITFDEPK